MRREWTPLAHAVLISGVVANCATAADMKMLMTQASAELSCPDAQLRTSEVDRWVERVDGCNKHLVYLWHQNLGTWASVLDTAAYQLSCPKEQIVVTQLDSRTVGAAGCEHKAIYKREGALGVQHWAVQSTVDAPTDTSAAE